MKGIVFTELCDMIEKEFGPKTLNKVIDSANLESGGVYSSVGTYKDTELVSLVTQLSSETKIAPQDLIHAYGKYFFNVLKSNYEMFFDKPDCFEFLKSIDNHIHVEVKKLYPDAELPRFSYEEDGNTLKMKYTSPRHLSSFALGLMEKTIEHYGEDIEVLKENLKEDGSEVLFTLTKK